MKVASRPTGRIPKMGRSSWRAGAVRLALLCLFYLGWVGLLKSAMSFRDGWPQAQSLAQIREGSAPLPLVHPRSAMPAHSQAEHSSPYDGALLLLSRGGDLYQAETLAQKAAALAHSPPEQFKAAFLLAQIECGLGRHRAELKQAQKMLALKPRNESSYLAYNRAVRCNRLGQRERQVMQRKQDPHSDTRVPATPLICQNQ
jgi:tetratricopeptide (TPR) repeat protein